MDEISRTTRYLFILGVLFMVLVYYAGANQLLKTSFSGINQVDLTATGRRSDGTVAPYATGY